MILRLVDRRTGKKKGLTVWDMASPWPDLRPLVAGLGQEDWHVDLVLVDDSAIAELNGDFRGKPEVTDVLSFSYLEDEGPGDAHLAAYDAGARHNIWWADPPSEDGKPEAVGEVILAPAFVADRCRRKGWPLEAEIPLLVIHGCLHLLGWEHEKDTDKEAMRDIEEDLLKSAGLDHPLRKRG
jgi:probable rRNA maturation factor